jgi:hypothetical protein
MTMVVKVTDGRVGNRYVPNVELYNKETGERILGVKDIKIHLSVDNLNTITVTYYDGFDLHVEFPDEHMLERDYSDNKELQEKLEVFKVKEKE